LRAHQTRLSAAIGQSNQANFEQLSATTGLPQEWWAFAWLHYASLCPVIDGWRALNRTEPSRYGDQTIADLLTSPHVKDLFNFRDAVFHYTSIDDERMLHRKTSASDLLEWAEQLHDAFRHLADRNRVKRAVYKRMQLTGASVSKES
jgi:hypothetical protein